MPKLTRRTALSAMGFATLGGMTGLARAGAFMAEGEIEGTSPFIGQLQPFVFDFTPKGWYRCDGSLRAIGVDPREDGYGYNPLYPLFETLFGGDGRTTFALPDLRDYLDMTWYISYGGRFPCRRESRYCTDVGPPPIVGQVQPFPFDFIPPGWTPCDGRLLPIEGGYEGNLVKSVIGSVYGGDGEASYGLPDLGDQHPALKWCIALSGVAPAEAPPLPGQLLGQIQSFAIGVVPRGWAQCGGQSLETAKHPELFSLLNPPDPPRTGLDGAPEIFTLPTIPDHLNLSWNISLTGAVPKRW